MNLCLEELQQRQLIAQNILIGSDDFPTGRWRDREIIKQWIDVQLPPQLESGRYTVQLCQTTNRPSLSLGQIEVQGRSRQFELPDDLQFRMETTFGEKVRLEGLNINLLDEKTVELTLYWQSLDVIEDSYKVFVHLLNQDGQIIAQSDQLPAAGAAPTTGWLPNEVIVDKHTITLPLKPDQIAIGLYHASSGQRVPTADNSDEVLIPLKF